LSQRASWAGHLDGLTQAQRAALLRDTPLWFYILREAELNVGRLKGVGARIVAETFHRAMEGSQESIVRDPTWRPDLGPNSTTFRMVDLLLREVEDTWQLRPAEAADYVRVVAGVLKRLVRDAARVRLGSTEGPGSGTCPRAPADVEFHAPILMADLA
jgi:hypothetical protein